MYPCNALKSINWKKFSEVAMALTWCAFGTESGSADLIKYKICWLIPLRVMVPPFSRLKRGPPFRSEVLPYTNGGRNRADRGILGKMENRPGLPAVLGVLVFI